MSNMEKIKFEWYRVEDDLDVEYCDAGLHLLSCSSDRWRIVSIASNQMVLSGTGGKDDAESAYRVMVSKLRRAGLTSRINVAWLGTSTDE